MAVNLAIEFDSNYISIYLGGNGVVLREPAIIAFLASVAPKNVYSVGQTAYEMMGRTPERTLLVSPIDSGIITDMLAARLMLSEFLRRVVKIGFLSPKVRALITLPCGLSDQERAKYARVCAEAGLKDFVLIEKVFATAAGLDLPIGAGFGGFVVDIGGGGTDIAALALNGIISGCGINVGGNMMDSALVNYIYEKYALKIGMHTARLVREEIGSLYPNDAADFEVSGIDARSKNPAGARIKANDTLAAYSSFFYTIAETAEEIINMCPPEIAADIHRIGINVSGECAAIAGVEEFLGSRLHLPVSLATHPCYAAISGAGRLIANQALLNEILNQL